MIVNCEIEYVSTCIVAVNAPFKLVFRTTGNELLAVSIPDVTDPSEYACKSIAIKPHPLFNVD